MDAVVHFQENVGRLHGDIVFAVCRCLADLCLSQRSLVAATAIVDGVAVADADAVDFVAVVVGGGGAHRRIHARIRWDNAR